MKRQHFYTTDAAEQQKDIDTAWFKDEGVACPVYVQPAPGPAPFYRSMAKNGAFLYTTSLSERDAATSAGEVGQGITCFLMLAADLSHIPFLRAFNPTTGDHFYTPHTDEFQHAVQKLGYVDEGIAGFVVPGIGPGLTSLFRLVNAKRHHFYTTDPNERDHAVQKLGFTDEGVTCGVETGPAPGPQPFYRSYHPKTGGHFYTMSITERDKAVNSGGQRGEGIAGNLFSNAQPDHVPLLQAYGKANDDWFYSVDAAEMANATAKLGYGKAVTAGFAPVRPVNGTTPLLRLYGPDAARELDFTEQVQTQTEWCWSATTVSVSKFYDPQSTWTQCSLANQQMGRTDCCTSPSGSGCNKPWYLDKSLNAVGCLAKYDSGRLSIDSVAAEILASHPLPVRIGWYGGGGHFPVISGFDIDTLGEPLVTIEDPIFGKTVIEIGTFPSQYQSGGDWTDTYRTKP